MSERQVSLAAKKLGRSQSAVSHALNRLRDTLDDKLFYRKEHEMVPTARALELSTHVSTALADLHGALDRFSEFDPETSTRHFTLGMSDATIFMFLPELSRRIDNHRGNISYEVRNVGRARSIEMLRTGDIDCMLFGDTPPTNDNFVREDLLTEKFLCGMWSPSGEPYAKISLSEYLERPHLSVAQGGRSYAVADRVLERMGLKRKTVATVPSYLVMPHIMAGTRMIATTGEAPLIGLAEKHGLTLAKPPMDMPDVEFSFVFEERSKSEPAMQWLGQQFREIAQDIDRQKQALYANNPHLF